MKDMTLIKDMFKLTRTLLSEAEGDAEQPSGDDFALDMGNNTPEGEMPTGEAPTNSQSGTEANVTQPVATQPEAQPQPEMGMDDGESVEVDVTSIVEKQEQMSQSIQGITSEIEQVKQMIQNLNNTGQILQDFQTKIAALETNITGEFKKRLPTERERLESQKTNSYPYNTRLTDYFESDADNKTEEEKEYSLTDVDVANNLAKMGGTVAKTF